MGQKAGFATPSASIRADLSSKRGPIELDELRQYSNIAAPFGSVLQERKTATPISRFAMHAGDACAEAG